VCPGTLTASATDAGLGDTSITAPTYTAGTLGTVTPPLGTDPTP
jgi:hypothetical protein